MDFRLLGPLAAVENDRQLALGGRKQRSLLALLLLHANAVVPAERIIDDLWGDKPPATVAKSIQVYVSRLRKELGAGRLITCAPGYLLRLDESELDVARFELLLAEARTDEPAAAAERLRDALALWRGPPLADLTYEPFAQAAIARLEELRLTAIEERIDADLALGRHAELVAELDGLVAEHPLREGLRRQQMLALYRAGRQGEALGAYREARARLVGELGIEPGPELRRLEQEILAQDSSLDGPAAPVSRVPRTSSGFVGRRRELSQLDDALHDALGGHGRLVLLAGEPGIGKSRLSEELLEHARDGGAQVLVGRCWEAGGAPAYWPWVQALRTAIRSTDAAVLRERLGPGAPDLAQLLPELREAFPDLAAPSAPESDGARFRLFEAAAAYLWNAAAAQPLVLTLDDLHAADEPSLLLLRFVARELGAHRVLVVCAFRDVDPTLGGALSATLAELVREPHAMQVTLGGLDEPDVATYVGLTTGGEPAPGLAAAIHAETEGNPLFVSEVVRLLADQGRIADSGAHLSIPPGVRFVIGQRVARLSEPCRSLLVEASVMGREFELDVLARLSDLARDDLLDVLDEAVSERILGDVPASPGRLRFGHALIRDTLYDELTAARRIALHRRAGEALESVYAEYLDPHLSELARHFYAAAPAGVAGKAIGYARQAGDSAAAQLAYEEAARHYELALTLVTEPAERCGLLLALGDAHARSGNRAASKEAYDQAADLARIHGLHEDFARAALGYGGRIIWDVSRDDPQLQPLLERALAGLPQEDGALRAKVLARLAGGPLRDARFDPAESMRRSDEALEMARRVGDPEALAWAIHSTISSHLAPDHAPRRLTLSTELLEVATRAGDAERVFDAHAERCEALFELGRRPEAELDLAAMTNVAGELRQPSQEWLVCAHRARLALLDGRLGDAERLVAEARATGEEVHTWNANVTYRLQLYALRRAQGRLDDVLGLLRQSVGEYPTYPIFGCVAAQAALTAGDQRDAQAALDALAADECAALPFDEEWLVSVCLLSEVACALGDREHAAMLHRRLLPYDGRIAISCQELSLGAAARYLGLLAATLGRDAEAERHFVQALELNARLGAVPWLAQTRQDYGLLLRARGVPGDQQRALELLAGARSAYAELGMPVA